jgi:hypothetical protein
MSPPSRPETPTFITKSLSGSPKSVVGRCLKQIVLHTKYGIAKGAKQCLLRSS